LLCFTQLRTAVTALPAEQTKAQPSTTDEFSGYLASLPAEVSSAEPWPAEQNYREYLVSLLAQPTQGQPSAIEPNYIYDLPQSENVKLSSDQQNYANYLVALRQEGESQPEVEAGTGANNAPVSKELKILSPQPSTVLDVTAATVTVQYPLGSQVELLRNGVTVDSSLIGGTETNKTSKVVTQSWYGVSLSQGENTLTAQIKINNSPREVTSVKIFVRGTAKQLTVKTVEARIPADGRSTANIQGELVRVGVSLTGIVKSEYFS
jgi:hypothetical protein